MCLEVVVHKKQNRTKYVTTIWRRTQSQPTTYTCTYTSGNSKYSSFVIYKDMFFNIKHNLQHLYDRRQNSILVHPTRVRSQHHITYAWFNKSVWGRDGETTGWTEPRIIHGSAGVNKVRKITDNISQGGNCSSCCTWCTSRTRRSIENGQIPGCTVWPQKNDCYRMTNK